MRNDSLSAESTEYPLPPGGPFKGPFSSRGMRAGAAPPYRPDTSLRKNLGALASAPEWPSSRPRRKPSRRNLAPRGPQAKKSPRPARALTHWRRGRDSNPRYVSVRLISSQVQSTTLPPLLNFVHSAWPVTAKSSILYRTRARLKPSARTIRQDTGGAPPAPRSSRPPAGSSRAPPPGCGRRPGPSRSRCARIRSCPARS